MAQNENNVILVNPNDALGTGLPADFKVAQPDDLTIFVELTTQKKNRSSIVSTENGGAIDSTSGSVGKVNFISGSPFGKATSLTTSYTDIGSASLQSNDKDLEGFGIESIDITFDTAYTPLIKIKFVDVRGGMFQRGADSKYSVFFELPYPLFNLKVKGYYGRTVSYCLHLVKWNSLFNSSTGNFEIDAEFIGYTFAILTDLLIGFMRAAPYTSIGSQKFTEIKALYESTLGDNLAGNRVLTIDEMFKKISDFQTNIVQINSESTTYKQLINLKKSVIAINDIKKRFDRFKLTLQEGKNLISGQAFDNRQDHILYVLDNRKSNYDDYKKDISELIEKLESFVDGITDSDKGLISNFVVTQKIQLSDFIENDELKPNSSDELVSKIDAEPKYDLEDKNDRNRVTKILENIKDINANDTAKASAKNGFYIYDFIKFIRVINKIIGENNNRQNELILKYQDELRGTLIDQFDFNPSVKNIFRILMASAETFLLSVQNVSKNASENTERKETLNSLVNNGLSDIKRNDSIYPFPLYSELVNTDGKSQIEEAWLGSNNEIDTSVVDEILYVEELLSALIKLKQADIDYTIDLNNSASWFSVNPLDSPFGGISLNPYYRLSIAGTSTNQDEYLRLLMYRTFTYLGLTNPKTLDSKVMEYMAKFEANNLYYGFPKSDYNSANQTNKTSIYENYGDATSIIEHWEKGSDKIKNYLGNTEPKPYMIPINDDYAYRYIYSDRSKAAYIPISGGFSGSEFYLTDNLLKNEIELREVNPKFLGNYVNSGSTTDDKVDDGAKYIDIISFTKYGTTPFKLPVDRAEGIIEDYDTHFKDAKLKENTINGPVETTKFDPLSYKFYSNEFFSVHAEGRPLKQIVDDDSLADLSAAFIDNPKSGSRNHNNGTRLSVLDASGDNQNVQLYNKLIKGQDTDDIIVPDISFTSKLRGIVSNSTENFSLFGSPLYYAQNAIQDPLIRNYSKSYLFLNTLPLKGVYGTRVDNMDAFKEDSLINGIFSKNGGFIKTPSLWIAWVGSILWRYEFNREFGSDPILTKAYYGGVNNPISIVRTFNDVFGKRHYTMPTPEELFVSLIDGKNPESPMYIHLELNNNANQQLGGYKKVDKVILSLPEQAKKTFINFFIDWSNSSFKKIKQEYQLLNDNAVTLSVDNTGGVDMLPWGNYLFQLFNQSLSTPDRGVFTPGLFRVSQPSDNTNINAIDNVGYEDMPKAIEIITPTIQNYSGNTFFLPYIKINLQTKKETPSRGRSNALLEVDPAQFNSNKLMRNLFADVSVIINYTPRTFDREAIPLQGGRNDITIPKSRLNDYLGVFTQEYKRLYDADQESEKGSGIREALFNSNNTNFIKLNIYRHLKAINDKWIYDVTNRGTLLSPCGEDDKDTLIDRFLFIDKNWEEIGDEFIINPIVTENLIRNKYNQSLYDVISNILAQNNFNFIPLPNYVEYNTPKQMSDNIFKPYPYIDMVRSGGESVGPKFICTYIGQTSNHLDIKNSEFPNDGINLNSEGEHDLNGLVKKGKPIPAFEVNYGTQNQNFFKDLKLDQREFVETQESLEIIDSISTSGDKNKVTFASQNLFNVYQTRSYSAEVTALGMPLIQPMMYFQLNNVPMFRGAYMIINTSHSIKPNHMTTTFKGVRVKKENTPINKQVIAMKDLNINESDTGEKYNINETLYDGSVSPNRSNSAGAPIVDIAATGEIYIDSFKKRISITTDDVINFNRSSNTRKNGRQMTFNEIFNEIGEKLDFDVELIKIMSVMESQGGTNKGEYDGINKSGFVGLMQFGWAATVDVTKRINNYLSNQIDINEYEFFGPLVDGKITYPNIYEENQWPKPKFFSDPDVKNDKTNNSMFDDYISTLAGVYYAFINIDGLESNPSIGDPTQIYIAHQQGKGGLNQINEFQDRDISNNKPPVPTNMQGNYPPILPQKDANGKEKTNAEIFKTNQDWYTGWAANVHAAGYRINPEYIPNDPFKPVFNQATGRQAPTGAVADAN